MTRQWSGCELKQQGTVRFDSRTDIDALADVVAHLSWLAYDLRDEIAKLDLNPVSTFKTRRIRRRCVTRDAQSLTVTRKSALRWTLSDRLT